MVAQEPAPSSIGDEDDVYAPEELASMRAYSLARPSVARIRVAGRGISAQGTGFLLHGLADGHIVTNAHVVAGGTHFTASFLLPDELNLDAVLVGVDKVRDIAVLRVRADALPAASRPLRSSRNAARVGQRVHVLGAPFGLSHSFTTGVVSATGREISVREGRVPLFDALQTDAAVNTGCSGGPVLSSSGLVVGMTVAIASPSGAFAGIGFAIPIHVVRAVAEMLIDSGGKRTLPSPSLGVTLVPARFARRLGLKEGVLVLSVHASGGAASAGIRGTRVGRNGTLFLGDVIVAINDVEVDEAVDLWREVWHKGNVGDEVKLKIRRQGEGEMIVKVRLGDALESAEDGEDAEAVGSGKRELNRQLPRAKL